MAVENLAYTGIDRSVTDYAGSRACEELINLRPTPDGIAPVKPFSVKMADTSYWRVFVHNSTSGNHIIGVRGTAADYVYVEWVRENDTPVELFHLELLDQTEVEGAIGSLSYAAAGNIILFSICDTADGIYENRAFIWKDNRYVGMEADVPEISYEILDDNVESGATSDIHGVWQDIARISESSSVTECVDAVQSGLNAIQEENPELCFGPVIVAVAFKTTDGSTFWTGSWRVYDPIPTIKADPDTPYRDATSEPSPVYSPFFNKYGFGYIAGITPSGGDYLGSMFAYGTKARLEFDQVSWNEETSIIRSLEVYCSKPAIYLDVSGAKDGLFKLGPGPLGETDYHLYLPQVKYADMDLAGQLLYHQASIPMSSLADGSQTVELRFGGNIQLTEDTLDVDAGAVKRYGRILSYNARFHYFQSVAHREVGMPYFVFAEPSGSTTTADVLAKYQDEDGERLLCLGELEGWPYDFSVDEPAHIVIAPTINVKEVILYAKVGGGYYEQRYRMTPSSTYNYSVCTEYAPSVHVASGTNAEYDAAIVRASYDGYGAISAQETAAINVTEQYNPFVFRVEHSYLAPGNVIDVQPQMTGVTDTSYGRDPLNVFTERGTYALTQGSADVLYGAFIPVSDVVVNGGRGGASPTPYGTFFLGAGSLWLIVGRRAQLISDALERGPHPYVRSCPGYAVISGPGGQYDVSEEVSAVPFWDFVRAARLSYNRFRSELMVSNPAYAYTYVLSLIHRQWFKLAGTFTQEEAGSGIVTVPSNLGRISVLDMETETSGTHEKIHLQTRPFSMAFQYCHVHRTVALARARLSGLADDILVSALYGSDDLQDWYLLAYAKRNGSTATEGNATVDVPLKISQLRTPSAARSWRYYTICIGGVVPTDSEFGPFLVDYEPVIRRIG